MPPRAPDDDGLPIGFAHRGAHADLRENTLPSFARALSLGATGLESDVWLSRDGVAVLDHDGVVPAGWRRRRIAETARADLPAHIPTLEDLYAACGVDFELSLDLKDVAAGAAVAEAARAAGALDRLWLCHPDPAVLAAWRAQAPGAGAVWSTSIRAREGGLPATLRQLSGAGIHALNLRSREWTPDAIAATHHAGLLAFAWDAQRRAVLRRLLNAGVDAVYSDHVGRMVAAIGRVRPEH
jgi:glycerophosphoryl diester phosphodiesterase